MFVAFAVNATAIMLVVSMVEGTRFIDVFRLPLALNVMHWLGNVFLGILGALVWAAEPVALDLDDRAGRARLRHLPALGRGHQGTRPDAQPVRGGLHARPPRWPATETFGDFLGLLEKLLPADQRGARRRRREHRRGAHLGGDPPPHGRRHGSGSARCVRRGARRHRSPDRPRRRRGGRPWGARGVSRARSSPRPSGSSSTDSRPRSPLGSADHRMYGKTLERARLSEIVSHTSDGVFTVDLEGRITTWNPAMHTLMGYSEDDAIGRRCEELLGLGLDRGPRRRRRRQRRTRRHDGDHEGRGTEGAPAPHEHDPRRRGGTARPDRRGSRRRRGDEGGADQARLRVDGLPRASLTADAAPRFPLEPRRGHRRRRSREAPRVLPDHAAAGAAIWSES